jgi:hypothetical protein
MRIYLAGPMRGLKEFNFPEFHTYASKLRSEGHEVFSPAERDTERLGVDMSEHNLTGDEEEASRVHGFNLREALAEDMMYICRKAEAVALLPGWENSRGARAEKAAAEALGLRLIFLEPN